MTATIFLVECSKPEPSLGRPPTVVMWIDDETCAKETLEQHAGVCDGDHRILCTVDEVST